MRQQLTIQLVVSTLLGSAILYIHRETEWQRNLQVSAVDYRYGVIILSERIPFVAQCTLGMIFIPRDWFPSQQRNTKKVSNTIV